MKLQPASRRELSRIAIGTLVCDAVLIAALFVLSLVGVGRFEPFRILLGAACGSVVAIVNFAILCLTVQSAAGMDDQKALKAKVQASYNGRLLMQGLWCLVSYLAPCFNVAAGVIPLLFPNILIYLRQAAGKNKS